MSVTITFEKKHFLMAGIIIALPFMILAMGNIFAATTMPIVGHPISELFVDADLDMDTNKIINSGNISISGSENGIVFSDGSLMTSADDLSGSVSNMYIVQEYSLGSTALHSNSGSNTLLPTSEVKIGGFVINYLNPISSTVKISYYVRNSQSNSWTKGILKKNGVVVDSYKKSGISSGTRYVDILVTENDHIELYGISGGVGVVRSASSLTLRGASPGPYGITATDNGKTSSDLPVTAIND